MSIRKEIDGRAMGLMLVLSMVWGLQQVGLKATASDIAPLMLIALRSGLAALLVLLLMVVRRENLSLRDGTLRPGLIVGSLFALEYLLVGEGLRHTSAAHIVVFLYTAPIFAALGLNKKLPSERLQPVQWVEIALAFSGIAVAFFGRNQTVTSDATSVLLGDILGLLAGAAWGATTVVVRTSVLANAPATKTLPPRQNSCRLYKTKNLGAAMKDANGTIRTNIQRQSGCTIATAKQHSIGSGGPGGWHRHGDAAALA